MKMKASLRVITILVILSMTLVACGTTSQPATTAANAKVNLTFWWWAESDAPGADAWMAETVAAYEKIHPNVSINIVPQST
jgi:ABC-type glycerol-3-phosphate transport system substrate-binding protein